MDREHVDRIAAMLTQAYFHGQSPTDTDVDTVMMIWREFRTEVRETLKHDPSMRVDIP